jgi:hypothetical protein
MVFKNKHRLLGHLNRSRECKSRKSIRYFKEVWLVPGWEERSTFDCNYVTKEMFTEAIGLNVKNEGTYDQEEECMNQHLNKTLMRSFYHVKDVSNPNLGARLFRAVMHLNSYKICPKKE